MGAYTNLKNAIKQVIKQNGNQEITGQLLQNTLLSMVDTLGTDYKYCGIATPTTVPSTDEGNMYYFAKESGSYTNFTDSAHTNLHIDEQGLYVFTKNAETDWWSSENLVSITQELGDSKDKTISQKAINDAINDAIEGVKKEVIKNYLYSKKILAVGDSMVQGHSLSDSKNQTWLAKIAIRNNMTRYNKGTNGAKLAKIEYNGTTDNSVFSKICESNTSQYISDDLLSTLDYILIYAGTNDIQNDVQIGDIDSNIATEFCGAINSICKNLQSRAPKAHIGFISPQLRAGIEQKCQTYIDALKKVCAKYSIPVYDQGLNSGICWSNANLKNALTLNDTYHLNENGMEFISYKYEAFLRSI